ncbi:MAG: hypothetical protein KGD59_04795 [Candidatus Heimdallarchaeota archaeon]|nr:hypothetical protein [Candidatus Heimdallarchaeota archaeon]MBY8993846.1 hypothetical protein [Candidatus Heimdallarchaeota archaeon]
MKIPRLVYRRSSRKLTIELMPTTVESKTLFQVYNKNRRIDDWKSIKDDLLRREGKKCWICDRNDNLLHIQEFWDFDDVKQTMKLIEIHHVCDLCHKIKRTDFWFFTDYGKEQLKKLGYSYEDIIKHYCKVNKCKLKEFGKNWRNAIETWKTRNKQEWQQDYGEFIS